MKSSKKIHIMNTAKCVIPIRLPKVEELVEGTKLKPDRLRLILHQFYVAYIFNELGNKTNNFHKEGWVTLDANRLKKLCKHYNAYLNLLEQKGLIEVKRNPITGNKSYVRNQRATAYRILPKFLRKQNNRRFRIETITDYTTVKSITKDKIQYSKNVVRNKNIAVSSSHKILYEMMNDVGVDTDALDAFLSTLNPQDLKRKRDSLDGVYNARILVDLINSDDEDLPMPTVDAFGERLHSIFTRMPGEFRKFFYVKSTGEPFKTIDIRNSQAYMLALIISHPEKLKKLLPEFEPLLIKLEKMKSDEHKYFFHLSKEGEIYDHWAELRGIKRDEGKDEIIKRILFSKPINLKEHKLLRSQFQLNFPKVWDTLNMLKKTKEQELMDNILFGEMKEKWKPHKVVSCMTQRLESRLLYGLVINLLIKQNISPIITIHDSVMVPESLEQTVKDAFEEAFTRAGLPYPSLK